MKDSIHKYFRIGTVQWMSHPEKDAVDSIREIACDDYFDAIEVRHFADDASRKQAKSLLQASHLKVCYAAQPTLLATGLNPNAVDEDERIKAQQVLLEAVDEAEYLGSKGVCIMAGHWEKQTQDIAFEQLVKTTKAVCAKAAQKGMFVELEVFDYDMDKCALIGPAAYAARYAEAVRQEYPDFGLLVDLSHIPTTHETTDEVMLTLAPYITHLHCGNAVVCDEKAPAYGDKHPRFGFPDSSNDVQQLTEFFRCARSAGLFCEENPLVMSIEVTPQPGEDSAVVLANSKRVINRAWALLED